jgi:hypothetical protein
VYPAKHSRRAPCPRDASAHSDEAPGGVAPTGGPSPVGMVDAKSAARFVRDELDALDALGRVDESMAAQAESEARYGTSTTHGEPEVMP